jgi:AcrR family transcriptional regulator
MKIEAVKRPRKPGARPSDSGRSRDDERALRREFILTAAIDAFYAHGFENTSVDDIAAAMSVTKAVLYYNFPSKMAVLEEIVDRTTAWSLEAIERGIAEGRTPAEKLARFALHSSAHILEHQKLVAIYFREERSFSAALLERARKIERRCLSLVKELLDAGVESGEFEIADTMLMAINIIGMISQAFYWYREGGRLSLDEVGRQHSDAALAMVRYRGQSTRLK